MAKRSSGAKLTKNSIDKNIAAHFSDGSLLRFTKEETIISGLDEPRGVYLIQSGFVKAYSVSKNGQVNLLLMHMAGEFMPLPWALDGAHSTGLFYEAMTDVTVLRVSKTKLQSAMDNNPRLTQEILSQAVDIIGRCTQRIQALEFRSARGRVIAQLLYMAGRYGKPQGTMVLIDIPITHQDIADSINMTRETASRALGQLFKEGLVGQEDHLFVIPDLAKLHLALS